MRRLYAIALASLFLPAVTLWAMTPSKGKRMEEPVRVVWITTVEYPQATMELARAQFLLNTERARAAGRDGATILLQEKHNGQWRELGRYEQPPMVDVDPL